MAWAALELGSCTVAVAELVGFMKAVKAVDPILTRGPVQFTDRTRRVAGSQGVKQWALKVQHWHVESL